MGAFYVHGNFCEGIKLDYSLKLLVIIEVEAVLLPARLMNRRTCSFMGRQVSPIPKARKLHTSKENYMEEDLGRWSRDGPVT